MEVASVQPHRPYSKPGTITGPYLTVALWAAGPGKKLAWPGMGDCMPLFILAAAALSDDWTIRSTAKDTRPAPVRPVSVYCLD